MRQFWVACERVSIADGPAVGNTTTATSLLNSQDKPPLPGSWFTIGKAIRIKARGRISNIVTTPGTLTLAIRWGASIVLATSQAMTINATATTNVTFELDLVLVCRAEGTTANFMLTGDVTGVAFGTGTTMGTQMIPATSPAVGSNVDVTATQLIDLFATWSVANAGNTLQLHQYTIESLN